VFVDYIQNGRGYGRVAEAMTGCNFEIDLLRPYIDSEGRRCVTINAGNGRREKRLVAEMINNGIHSPVFNATSLRKDEWVLLDQVVVKAARQRLRAWSDLSAANTFGGFNGMSKTILEHQTSPIRARQ